MLDFVPALQFSMPALSSIFVRAFEGYFITFPDDPGVLEYLVRCEGLSLKRSKVALAGGEPVAVGFVSVRGATSRLAGLGVASAHRRSGIGRKLMGLLLEEARAREDERMLLEVVEENERAVVLYEQFGFARTRRLLGFDGFVAAEAARLESCSIEAVAALLHEGLPWQAGVTTVRNLATPNRAVRLGSAFAVVAADDDFVRLRTIAVEPGARRQGAATRLLRAIAAAHPGKRWQVGRCVPEGAVEQLLLGAGLGRSPFMQWEMAWTR